MSQVDPLTLLPHPRLGSIEVRPEDVIKLVAPLPPFMGLERFVLLPDPEEEPFQWLQSLDQPALCFVLIPFAAVSATVPELPLIVRHQLGLGPDGSPETYAIVSLAAEARQVTVNLLAPLVVCRRTRRARQVVTDGDLALARTPLL